MSGRPPRLARALVRRLSRGDSVEFVLADLDDDYSDTLRRGSRLAARWRYWRLALASIVSSWRPAGTHRPTGRALPLGAVGQDARVAVRMLRKHPGFAAVAILTLALGIGVNTAIFSVVNGVLLRPLPYADPSELVNVWQVFHEWEQSDIATLRARADRFPASWPVYREWTARSRTLDSLAAYANGAVVVERSDAAEWVSIVETTETLPAVLGMAPAAGRWFAALDTQPADERVAVISDGLAGRWFGGAADALGQTIRLTGTAFTIVGVMPPDFYFPTRSEEVWIPIRTSRRNDRWTSQSMSVVGRLSDGIAIDTARTEMAAIADQIRADVPDAIDAGVRLVSRVEEVAGATGPTLWLLAAAVGLVLAIATANVAGLLLVRATSRRQELAVRQALGARRTRLLAQLLVEGGVLALAGGAVGLLTLAATFGWVRSLLPPGTPRLSDVAIDWRVLVFATVASGIVALAVGLTSAARAIRVPAVAGLRLDGTRVLGRQRGRAVLVTAEVAVSVVLLAAAVLVGESYLRLSSVDRGFESAGRLTAEVTAPLSIWDNDDALRRFFDDVVARASALPGVTAAGAVTRLPFSGGQSSSGFGLVSNPVDESDIGWSLESDVTPGYFDAMGISLVRGRFLSPKDAAGSPRAVVINERLARNFFADRDPLGATIWEKADNDEIVGLEIVGIVGDYKHANLREEVEAKRFRPSSQRPTMQMTLVVRVDGDADALVAPLRAAVRGVEPLATVTSVATMDGLVAASTALPRFRALMLATLAAMAVVLALVGVYGVVAFAVTDRTREIGVRISLGARRADVLRHVLGGGLWMILPGVAVGTLAALAAGRLLESYLFEVTATDPAILAGVAAVICALALTAVLMPARRASRVDPLIALRE